MKGGLVVFYALFRCRLARLQSGENSKLGTGVFCSVPIMFLIASLFRASRPTRPLKFACRNVEDEVLSRLL